MSSSVYYYSGGNSNNRGLSTDEDDDDDDNTVGVFCCILGLLITMVAVGVVITIAVVSSDAKMDAYVHKGRKTLSPASTYQIKTLLPGVMESLSNQTEMEQNIIEHTSEVDKLDLLVLVHSLPDSNRNNVRQSWKKDTHDGVEVIFVVPAFGISRETLNAVTAESDTHRDMVIFLNGRVVPESEMLLLELTWAFWNMKFDYLLKTRDSMYVHLPLLITKVVLKLKRDRSNSFLGYFRGNLSPRDRTSKKHPEYGWFLCDKFIRFAHSGGYMLSSELVGRLASQAEYLYPYNNEDIALGTWLSPYNDVDWQHDIRFDTELGFSRGCKNDLLVFPSVNMIAQHDLLKTTGEVCTSENSLVNRTYTYNFDTYPSKCCTPVL